MSSHIPPGQHCDPACQKIIIDSGFAAIAARVLAKEFDQSAGPALRFAEIADRHREAREHAFATGVLYKKKGDKVAWDGCHRATEIMAWVLARGKNPSVTLDEGDINAKLAQWSYEELEAMASLMAGVKKEPAE